MIALIWLAILLAAAALLAIWLLIGILAAIALIPIGVWHRWLATRPCGCRGRHLCVAHQVIAEYGRRAHELLKEGNHWS